MTDSDFLRSETGRVRECDVKVSDGGQGPISEDETFLSCKSSDNIPTVPAVEFYFINAVLSNPALFG